MNGDSNLSGHRPADGGGEINLEKGLGDSLAKARVVLQEALRALDHKATHETQVAQRYCIEALEEIRFIEENYDEEGVSGR